MLIFDHTTEFIGCLSLGLQCVKRYRRARLIFQHLLSDANTPRDRAVLQGCILPSSTYPPTHIHIHSLTVTRLAVAVPGRN